LGLLVNHYAQRALGFCAVSRLRFSMAKGRLNEPKLLAVVDFFQNRLALRCLPKTRIFWRYVNVEVPNKK